MERRAKTKEQRLLAPRRVSTPKDGYIGTIQLLDSGFWSYERKNGTKGITETAKQAVARLTEQPDSGTDESEYFRSIGLPSFS